MLNKNLKVLGAYFRNGTYTLLRDRQTDREGGEREEKEGGREEMRGGGGEERE